jgi:hypothetical protein
LGEGRKAYLQKFTESQHFGPEHGSGDPHLQQGEFQKAWNDVKPTKPRK